MVELKLIFAHERTHNDGKNRHDKCSYSGLDLHQCNIADDHLEHLARGRHIAEIGLRGEPGGEAHVQVTLEAQQRRHKDKQFAHVHKDFPMLWKLK